MGILKCTHTINSIAGDCMVLPAAARLSIADPGRGFAQALAQGHASG